ncbi:hypothetical protein [Ruminiclostridium papyrosolvens]|uniref:Uncharacterized protein n=1 Tax=Ruminiclostridium papyrosolvens C7 TaxID=1330534 RepID=U4QZX4_9FIRM|nr:hypothetical protein [Ruminiclostridium papyrosolvens]EPR10534.1 hypothetical protein L323_13160 [Ruminiclostridium papyrosolvens C7]
MKRMILALLITFMLFIVVPLSGTVNAAGVSAKPVNQGSIQMELTSLPH